MQIFVPGDPKTSTNRLVELSGLTNLMFYLLAQRGQQRYSTYSDRDPRYEIEITLRNKRDKFEKIVRRFPFEWSVPGQAAYILRAYSGLQIFPDANHRSGIAVSRMHLKLAGFDLRASPREMRTLIEDIRYSRSPFWARCNASVLAERNPPLLHIAAFYNEHVVRLSLAGRIMAVVRRSTGTKANFLLSLGHFVEDPVDEAARKKAPDPPE